MNKDIAVIGIGMDGDKTLTAEAKEAIESAELIIGARRMVKPFEHLNRQMFISFGIHQNRSAYVRRLWLLQRHGKAIAAYR